MEKTKNIYTVEYGGMVHEVEGYNPPTEQDMAQLTQNVQKYGGISERKETGLEVAESTLGSAYETMGQPFVPKGRTGQELLEAGLKTVGGFIPGGRAATEGFIKEPMTRTAMSLPAAIATPVITGAMTLPAVITMTATSLMGTYLGKALFPKYPNIAGTVGGMAGGAAGMGSRYALGKGVSEEQALKGATIRVARPKAQRTGKLYSKAVDKQVQGMKEIAANKDLFVFQDKNGNTVSRLPQNLEETLVAIDVLKNNIYKMYTQMAKDSGKYGNIKLKGLAEAIYREFKSNKYFNFPNTKKAALDRIGMYLNKEMTPEEIQMVIQNINSKLGNYMQRGIYETGQSADVDAFIALKLGNILDDYISGVTGAGYKNLKGRYGSIVSLEKDLVRRLAVDMRKQLKGFFDLSEVFADGQIVRGMFDVAKQKGVGNLVQGATMKAVSNLYKVINNPNRQLAKALKMADSLVKKGKYAKFVPEKVTGQGINISNQTQVTGRPNQAMLEGRKIFSLEAPKSKVYGEGFSASSRPSDFAFKAKPKVPLEGDAKMPYITDKMYKSFMGAKTKYKYYKGIPKYVAENLIKKINQNKNITKTSEVMQYVMEKVQVSEKIALQFIRDNYAKLRK